MTRAQLCEHGMPADAIDSRVRSGRLRQLHRGVYRAVPLVVPRARDLAALLACGPHACISHGSAAFLWQLLPDPGDVRVEASARAIAGEGLTSAFTALLCVPTKSQCWTTFG